MTLTTTQFADILGVGEEQIRWLVDADYLRPEYEHGQLRFRPVALRDYFNFCCFVQAKAELKAWAERGDDLADALIFLGEKIQREHGEVEAKRAQLERMESEA